MTESSANRAPVSSNADARVIDAAAAWRALLSLRDAPPDTAVCLDKATSVRLGRDGDLSWSGALGAPDPPDSPQPVEVLPEAAVLFDLYLPFLTPPAGDLRRPTVFAHLGQSLDGRIATSGGRSKWVTGEEDLVHTHRMRALADAVLVGAGTVMHDDPRLTVRRVAGVNPLRVVIDSARRLDGASGVFTDGAADSLVLCVDDGAVPSRLGRAEVVPVLPNTDASSANSYVDLAAGLRVLAARGVRRLFVEGGGVTVSRFLDAGLLDRLQLAIAPIIIGSGRSSMVLPEIEDLSAAIRPPTRVHQLGGDLLVECCFVGSNDEGPER